VSSDSGGLLIRSEVMKIFIPSLGRVDQTNHTFENLPPAIRKRAVMVVSPKEVVAYSARFGADNVVPVAAKGIGKVRQRIIDICDGPVLMLDDDLSFFARREDDPTKLRKATPEDVTAMVGAMAATLEDCAHAAIAVREGANRNTDPVIYNTRCLRALGYNATILKGHDIRFDRLPVMEDFDVALQLLRKGFRSVTLNRWAQDQGTSNAPGGCSTYRSREVQAQGARGLAKLHPDFVTVVTKETKGAWGGGSRTDVRVAWKKAYESCVR
jgi:hypothetical protein